MCYTMAAERKKATNPCIRPCVENGNEEVFDYLSETFKRQNLYYCKSTAIENCMFVCPKENLPFSVVEPLEFFLDYEGKKRGLLAPGNYRIIEHLVQPSFHLLVLEKFEGKRSISVLACLAGWKNGFMIDWRGIRPVKI